MARIVVISKYPPTEGGIASKTYWLARSLAERGHTIHIVTDKVGVDSEYCEYPYSEETGVENISVHRPTGEIPWHIPNDMHTDLDLLNTAVKVIEDSKADVIDTGYLIPYGLLGNLASRITGAPFILRHGGSDINKFLKAGIWETLLREAFEKAALVITDKNNYDTVSRLSDRVKILPPYVPDPNVFKPSETTNKEVPVFALIGKANYYWRHKGWHKVVEILQQLTTKFKLIVVSQGIGFKEFKRYFEENIGEDVEWRSFCHLSEMPALLNSIDGMFILYEDLPFPAFSNLFLETLICGKTVITDRSEILQSYKNEGLSIERFVENVIQIPANDAGTAARIISEHFKEATAPVKTTQSDQAISKEDYLSYIRENEKAILSVL
ncbi:MAG: glycosyltransferase [Deltaproteobacteria bacterium]